MDERAGYAGTTSVPSITTATLRCSRCSDSTSTPCSGRVSTRMPSTPASGPLVIRARCPSFRYVAAKKQIALEHRRRDQPPDPAAARPHIDGRQNGAKAFLNELIEDELFTVAVCPECVPRSGSGNRAGGRTRIGIRLVDDHLLQHGLRPLRCKTDVLPRTAGRSGGCFRVQRYGARCSSAITRK